MQIILLRQSNMAEAILKLKDALNDPFFWIMVLIFWAIAFWIYRNFFKNDNQQSEESIFVENQLQQQKYNLQNIEQQASSNGNTRSSWWKVRATNPQGQHVDFVVQINYQNGQIAQATWEPPLIPIFTKK